MTSPLPIVANLTVDDFDSLIVYKDQSQWTTPDTWGPDFHPESSEWLGGTYHKTSTVGATFSYNFTGTAVYLYGASGPSYGKFEVTLNSKTSTHSAYATQNASNPHLLYSVEGLQYDRHTLQIRNAGADGGGTDFLFDFIRAPFQLAPAGATVTNKTIQEDDPILRYQGEWGNNKSGNFSGGGTTYTGANGASVEFDFQASAIYVFGDRKNDHRLFTVELSSPSGPNTTETYNGISGCGGVFGLTCELQQPSIKYFASNLGNETYHLKITNIWTGNQSSFFDLDDIVLSVPSEYAPVKLGSATIMPSGSASPIPTSHAPLGGGNNAATMPIINPLLLLLFGLIWCVRRL